MFLAFLLNQCLLSTVLEHSMSPNLVLNITDCAIILFWIALLPKCPVFFSKLLSYALNSSRESMARGINFLPDPRF